MALRIYNEMVSFIRKLLCWKFPLIRVSLLFLLLLPAVIDFFTPFLFFFSGTIQNFQLWFPFLGNVLFMTFKGFYPFLSLLILISFYIDFKSKFLLKNIAFLLLVIFVISCLLYNKIEVITLLFLVVQFIILIKNTFQNIKITQQFKPFLHSEYNVKLMLNSLIVVVVLARFFLFFFTDNSYFPDSGSRLLISKIWTYYMFGNSDWLRVLNPVYWPPLHFYITGGLWKVSHSPLFIRFVHLVFSLLSAIYIYKLSIPRTGKSIALIVCICYLAYPLNVILSTQVMSENFYFFLLVATLYYFDRHLFFEDKNGLAISSLICNLATIIRFEAWFLSFFMLLARFIQTKKITRNELIWFLTTAIGPLFILTNYMLRKMDPLWGVYFGDMMVEYNYSTITEKLPLFWKGYKDSLIPFAFLSAFAVLLIKSANSRLRFLVLFLLLYMTPFLFKTITFTVYPEARYIFAYNNLLLIPLVFTLYFIAEKVTSFISVKILVTLISSTLLTLFGLLFINTSGLRFPKGYNETIEYVNTNLTNANISVDFHPGVGMYNWIAETKTIVVLEYEDDWTKTFVDYDAIRSKFQRDSLKGYNSIPFLVTDYQSEFNDVDTALLYSVLKKGSENYLVLFKNGYLNKKLKFENKTELYGDIALKRVFYLNEYSIYKTVP